MDKIEAATPIYPLSVNMDRGDVQCTSIEAARQIFLTPNGLDPLVSMIENDARGLVVDVLTKEGRKQLEDQGAWLKRVIKRLQEFKTNIVAPIKEEPKRIDAAEKAARDYLMNVHADIMRPLVEIQAREDKLRFLSERPNILTAADAATLRKELETAKAIDDSAEEWRESTATAKEVKAGLVEALESMLERRVIHEADLAEFEAHKREKAETEMRERIEKETREKIEREHKRFTQEQHVVETLPVDNKDAEAYDDLKTAFRAGGFSDPVRFVLDQIKSGKVRHVKANI